MQVNSLALVAPSANSSIHEGCTKMPTHRFHYLVAYRDEVVAERVVVAARAVRLRPRRGEDGDEQPERGYRAGNQQHVPEQGQSIEIID